MSEENGDKRLALFRRPRVSDPLETEAQRHLDLPRASDGLIRDA